ncbi:DUF2563 family protein [Kitasatospora sp. NBC_01287]|uniref:DUF2563 family protein n=1 Tax=Kitasatospora sp. NBC_01287 TaxID=2903573 RepID=UPI00225700AF|nr:DUF2563 family protein [Kitasatospora sp. NBC_01287]MCX4748767.1 DUF2563 family protein [Kitasatospora sp. NBC_01287]
MADKGSSGAGAGAGSGYQVEVDSLRAFAGQVRGLLAEFQQSADGPTTHARTGVGSGSFGQFAEAKALHDQYDLMRDGLRDVLTALQEAIDDAQSKADLTATNYEEQEHDTARSLRVSSDGWSVGTLATSSPAATYGAAAAGAATGAAVGRKAATSGGRKAGRQGTPVTGQPVDQAAEVPASGLPVGGVPVGGAPVDGAPGEGTPSGGAPVVPGAVVPGGGAPDGSANGNSARPGSATTPEDDGTTGRVVEQPTW